MQLLPEDIEASPHTVAIAGILSDGKPHKAGEIAFALKISSRTVRRHIHWMRDELGMPIEAGIFGFWFKRESEHNLHELNSRFRHR